MKQWLARTLDMFAGHQHVGLWYLDDFACTPDGWRIAARRQQKGYLHNL
jgi:hypothetical protein